MHDKLEFSYREAGAFRLLIVSGEIDMHSSPRLLDGIREALRDATGLKIDLRGVTYVDSSGIAILIQGYKLAKKSEQPYVLVDPSSQIMAVIELSQLDKFFEFEISGDRE